MPTLQPTHAFAVFGFALLATAVAHPQTRRPPPPSAPAPTFVRPSVGGQDTTTYPTAAEATLRCLEQHGANETVHRLVPATAGHAGRVCEFSVDKTAIAAQCPSGWTVVKDLAGNTDLCRLPDKVTQATTCPAGFAKVIQPEFDVCTKPDGVPRAYTLGACTRGAPPYPYATATCPSFKHQPSEADRVARAVSCPSGWSLVTVGVQSAYCERKSAAPR